MAYLSTCDNKKIWFDTVGTGDPLVLIGGSSIVHRQWDFMVPILKDNFKLILFDQRGAGLSDRSSDNISIDQWTDDLKMILDDIGVPKAHILATSNGSLIAIRFAAKYPAVTAAVSHYGIYKLTEQYRKMSRIGAVIVDQFGVGNGSMGAYFLNRMYGTPALCEDWVIRRFEENLSPEAWKAMHDAIDVDLTSDLQSIHAPQLIMMGQSGPLGESSDYSSGTREIKEMLLDVKIVTIADSNGTFHVLTRPFECAKVVMDFFAAHSSLL